MLEPTTITKLAPIIFFIGTGFVAICTAIVLQRAFCANLSPSIFLISSIMTAVATTFFYGILWLTITLISPNENHFAPILTALIITGYIPATILALLGYKPNRQGEETNNVINNDNEISND